MDYDEQTTLYRKHNLDDILPFQYLKIFDAFPYEVKDVIVRAVCRYADRWMEGYMQAYQSRYGARHKVLRAESILECRTTIISVMMYGMTWLDFDKLSAGYMRNADANNGTLSKFLAHIPVLNPL